jgi:hypothetical protein
LLDPGSTGRISRQSGAKVRLRREGLLNLSPPALQRGSAEGQLARGVVNRQASDGLEAFDRHPYFRSSGSLSVRPAGRSPENAFLNACRSTAAMAPACC